MSSDNFAGMTLTESPSGLLVPEGRIPEKLEAKCPAASITRFANTGRPAVFCGIAQEGMAVDDNPVGTLGWCCSDYQDCPVWKAEKDNDPVVARQRVARAAARTRDLTKRQIETGVRVDDRDEEQRQQAAAHVANPDVRLTHHTTGES